MVRLALNERSRDIASENKYVAIIQLFSMVLMSLVTQLLLPLYYVGTWSFLVVSTCVLASIFLRFPKSSQSRKATILVGCLAYVCVFIFDHFSVWFLNRVAILDLLSLVVSLIVIKVECTFAMFVSGSIGYLYIAKQNELVKNIIFCAFVVSIVVISIMSFEGVLPSLNVVIWLAHRVN